MYTEEFSVLVTGANRGLGLALVRRFLTSSVRPTCVFAACRHPEKAEDLHELQRTYTCLTIVKIDLCDLNCLPHAVKVVQTTLGEGKGLNLLINNAGIARRDTVKDVKADTMMEHFTINTIGPLMVSKAFHGLLKLASEGRHDCLSGKTAAIINISSGVGSIGENDTGGGYAYRTSKAGLNMVTRNLSIDLKQDGILVSSIHPGWLKTDLGGPKATMEVDDAAQDLIDMVLALEGDSCSGQFYHYSGRTMAF